MQGYLPFFKWGAHSSPLYTAGYHEKIEIMNYFSS